MFDFLDEEELAYPSLLVKRGTNRPIRRGYLRNLVCETATFQTSFLNEDTIFTTSFITG